MILDCEIRLHGTVEISIEATFTAEEETLLTRQYENGYNIPNPQYIHWVELNHPEDRLVDLFPDVTPLEPLNMNSCLPEERCPAASNTLPLESSDPLPHTETVSPRTTEENATMLLSSTVNNHLFETSFTPPNTSSESASIEPASTDNPPELTYLKFQFLLLVL